MAEYGVLVTASRTWTLRSALYRALDDAERRAYELGHRVIVVVHGAARGGDMMADDWARLPSPLPGMIRRPEPHALGHGDWYPAGTFDWRAGFRRNAGMVALGADECIAAIDKCVKRGCRIPEPHDSHGASDCIKRAESAGITVRKIRP